MQGGLVKTLDFKINLGLPQRDLQRARTRRTWPRTQLVASDMDVVTSTPSSRPWPPRVTPEEARTNIDIGGPCMVRASAKNYLRVASVTDPADYAALVDELRAQGGALGLDTRFRLMKKAFGHTAQYDAAIASFFAEVPEDKVRRSYTVHGAP
jgi:phosphoribosylaminoimidazolecarboxamide formyltransferase/IMP cyclohydrolase